jgi:hypothetical protein
MAVCLLALLAGFPASAQVFNDDLVRSRADSLLSHSFTPVPDPADRFGPPEFPPRDAYFPGFKPPKDYLKPRYTYEDSIDVTTGRIKRFRDIRGLRVEPYAFPTVDEYMKNRLSDNYYNLWGDNTSRMREWTDDSVSGGGLADLDFVVPGSKALERFIGGETRININGSMRVTFSGRSEWTEGQVETSVSKNSSFPSLTMKQEPRFQIKGTIADRITVDIKQDPQMGSFSNLEENINIKYNGEDRDIIRHIEAGNVSLSLPGATFAGYRGAHKGLFGLRAEGQLGPLDFTTIASQEKSEANVKSFRGSAEEATTQIRDYEYKANTYFFLDLRYYDVFAEQRDSFDRIYVDPADSIYTIEVYADDGIMNNNLTEGTYALRGAATPTDYSGNFAEEYTVDGYYHRLDPARDYYVDRSLGFIQFSQRVQDEWTIGVYMVTKSGEVYGDLTYDTEDEHSSIDLKLIKRKKQRPTDKYIWDLEWKNVYDLGQRDIDPEGLEIRIKKEASDGVSRDTQDGVPYIQILGIDKANESGDLTPDNKIDLNRGFVNFYRGELIIPLLRPFDSPKPPAGVDTELTDRVPEIYDSQNYDDKVEATTYFIEVQTANRQAVLNLSSSMGGILEGTEEVLLDGRRLAKGTDYRIDYFSGRLTLLNEDAMSPTANLEIRFEDATVMQEMQKTLVGFQADYDLMNDSRIGGVALFKNESTTEQRVRLGQEPSRMLLFDANGDFKFQSRGVTSLLDKLPGLVASTPSSFRIETEVAKSLPTLNTRGEVYIDDFEGSQNMPVSVVRTNWTTASLPDPFTTGGQDLVRGRLQWYNPWDRVDSKDIWPKKETSAGENTVHVLNLAYGKPEGVPDNRAFAGLMNSFWGSGLDMSRARFLEVWARGAKGTLKIDLGSISEDYFPLDEANGVLDTEDKPIPGQGHGDGVLVKDEDTGLDGVFDALEPDYNENNRDPSNDNFKYSSGDRSNYTRINGTEGNASDGDRLGIPDTEDINANGILDVMNAYYEYSISFSDPFDPYLVVDSVPDGDQYGWRLFRIPLWDNPDAEQGGIATPDSTLIEFARMWITDVDTTLVQIASIEIVENSWLEEGIYDSDQVEQTIGAMDRIRITTANTHENQEYYPPPGVKAEIDRQTKIRKKEQSLMVQVENLGPGNTAFVYRNFEKMNFTDYTKLSMFAHGPEDGLFPMAGASDSPVELVLRFGADKENYYEYHTMLYSGWASANKVEIDFAQCTALKLREAYDDFLFDPVTNSAPADTLGGKIFTLMGRPSLDNIRNISIGVKNNHETELLNADIWLDELQMDEVRDMNGTASRLSMNNDLAGFLNVKGEVEQKTADFHDMNSKTGSGKDDLKWDASMTMNMDRFLPKRWNINMPVSYSTTSSQALPRLKSGSDIILSDSQKEEFESNSENKNYSVRFNKQKDDTQTGISGFLLNWTVDKFSTDYTYGERASHTPLSGDRNSNTSKLNATYDVNPQEKTVKLFGWMPYMYFEKLEKLADLDVVYSPSMLSYDYEINENNQYNTNVDGIADTTSTRNADTDFNFGYSPVKALQYTFTRNTSEDLILKQEVKYSETNRINLTGPEILRLKNRYTYQSSYNETDNPRYSVSSQAGTKSIKRDQRISANATLDWQLILEDFSGKPKPPKDKFVREKYENRGWDEEVESDGEDSAENGDADAAGADDAASADDAAEENDRAPAVKRPGAPDAADTTPDGANGDEPARGEKKKPGTGIRTKVMMAMSRAISPLTVDYTRNTGITYAGIEDRPDFSTRFGSGTIDEPDSITVVSRGNTESTDDQLSAQTKVTLPLDIGFSTTAKHSAREQLSSSANTRSENTTFPEVKLDWANIERFIPMVDKYLSNLRLNSSYVVTAEKNWRDDNPNPVNDKNKQSFSPLVSVSARLFNQMQTTVSYNTSNDENFDLSGTTRSRTLVDANGTNVQIQYNLGSSGLFSFLQKLKVKSDINLTLAYRMDSTETSRGIGSESVSRISSKDSWSVSPKADYRFSNKLRGGMMMEFGNSKDMTNKVHKVREVSIWGELTF